MLDRIKQIMKENELQASSFADKIQVSRGTISHILNGRNDPSKDTIEKILATFPDISPSWLFSGEGPMYNRDRIFIQPTATPAIQPDLFDENKNPELSEKTQGHENSPKNEVKKPENKANSAIIHSINIPNTISKKIDKIMIFFNDKTFLTFLPEE